MLQPLQQLRHPLLQALRTPGAEAAQAGGDAVGQHRQRRQQLRQALHQVGGLPDHLSHQHRAQRDHQRQQRQRQHRRQKAPLQPQLSPCQRDGRLHQRRKAQRQQKRQQPHQRVA